MSITWRDGLATVFVGAAVALYLLWVGGTTVAGLSSPRALSLAVFGLGIAGCYTAKSRMAAMYGVGGNRRPPLFYVVLVSLLGGFTVVAGIVAIVTTSGTALATLTWAMVALWALSTIHHALSRTPSGALHTTR